MSRREPREPPPQFQLRRVPVHRPKSEPCIYRLVPTAERWPMTRHEFLRGSLLAPLGGSLLAGCGGGGGGDSAPAPAPQSCPAPSAAALSEAAYRAFTQSEIRAHASFVSRLLFSADGRFLVSAGGSGGTAGNGNRDHTEIKLWSMPGGRLEHVLSDDFPATGLVWSDDGSELYVHSASGFQVWRFDPTRLVATVAGIGGGSIVVRNGAVKGVYASLGPVNPRVTITAWNLASGRELFTTVDPLPKEAFEAIQNPASSVMAISFRDGAIHLMQATGTRQLLHMLAGHADAPVMAFSPDSRLLASAGGLGYAGSDANPPLGDPTVKVWDVATGALLRTFTGHTNKINALAFSADGSRLASGSGANVTTAGLPTFTTPGSNPFANARDENSVRVWDVASGTPLQAFTGLAWRIRAVALSPDGRYVAAGSQDNTIKLWDTTDGTLVAGLFDPRALEPDKAVNYAGTTLGAGQAAQRAYPTSAALPAAATCTCNCVAGSYAPKPPAGGGGPCSLVCVCVPVQYPGF